MQVDFHDASGISAEDTWRDEDEQFTIGTLRWIVDNGFVRGSITPGVGKINMAQLTASAWAILQRKDGNTAIQPLGAAIVDASTKGGRELAVVSEILLRRLTGA